MAPIPDDNQEKPPGKDDDSDLNSFSTLNMGTNGVGSDSSDENDDNYPDTSGYTLLPQEPDNDADDSEDDDIYENTPNPDSDRDDTDSSVTNGTSDTQVIPNHLPNEVIESEGGVSAPTVSTSAASSLHPEFLAKFPDGKVPSYMQVPAVPTSHEDSLWNKKRTDKGTVSLDSAEESKILKAMSGFCLPVDNVPEWARNMSDDEWYQQIVQQIKPGQETSNSISDSGQVEQNTDSISEQNPQPSDNWVAHFPE